MQQPVSKILVTGVSRSGKSYFAQALHEMGLLAIDLDNQYPEMFAWYSDEAGEKVEKPAIREESWFETHHYLIDVPKLSLFLEETKDCIIFAHAWNIWDCLPLFDKVYFLSVSEDELERRLDAKRSDHGNRSATDPKKIFMRQRHAQRLQEAKERGIQLINATLSPEKVYEILMSEK